MNTSKGFTLIEILIVIIIISITIGFAMIIYGDFGASRRVLFSLEQLANTLKLTQQKAILESTTFGLRIDNTGYQILQFKKANWQPLSNKGMFKPYYFPKNMLVMVKTENNTASGNPPILIDAAGGMTPFTLSFGTDKDNMDTTLTGSHNGNLVLTVMKPK